MAALPPAPRGSLCRRQHTGEAARDRHPLPLRSPGARRQLRARLADRPFHSVRPLLRFRGLRTGVLSLRSLPRRGSLRGGGWGRTPRSACTCTQPDLPLAAPGAAPALCPASGSGAALLPPPHPAALWCSGSAALPSPFSVCPQPAACSRVCGPSSSISPPPTSHPLISAAAAGVRGRNWCCRPRVNSGGGEPDSLGTRRSERGVTPLLPAAGGRRRTRAAIGPVPPRLRVRGRIPALCPAPSGRHPLSSSAGSGAAWLRSRTARHGGAQRSLCRAPVSLGLYGLRLETCFARTAGVAGYGRELGGLFEVRFGGAGSVRYPVACGAPPAVGELRVTAALGNGERLRVGGTRRVAWLQCHGLHVCGCAPS